MHLHSARDERYFTCVRWPKWAQDVYHDTRCLGARPQLLTQSCAAAPAQRHMTANAAKHTYGERTAHARRTHGARTAHARHARRVHVPWRVRGGR